MNRVSRLLSILILAALLVSCAQATTQPPAAPTQAPVQPTQAPPPTQAPVPTAVPTLVPTQPPAPTEPPVVSRPIVIIASDNESSADPAENWAFGGAAYLPQVYDSLFRFVGESSPKLEPLLAAEIPTVDNGGISKDGLVYTIKLKPNVKFHDGSALNADAVVYSYDRIKALKLGPEGIAATWISKTEKIDDQTVKFTLNKPFSDFLNAMSSVWGNYIVNPTVCKAHETNSDWCHAWLLENEAGSGPYTMTKYDKANNQVTLERFKEYWGGWTNPKPIDKAVFLWLADPTGARQMLEKGDADIAINLPATDFAAVEKASGFVAKKYASIMQYYIALNGSSKPLDNPKVRQALQYSFDYDKVISDIFLGNLLKMQAAVGPGYPDVYPAKTQYTFDLDKAKSLLKDAGFANGFELSANAIGAMPNDTSVLEFWQADLAKIGITLKIQNVDYGTFDAAWNRCKATTTPNIGQVSALGVGGDYPSAWEVMAQVFPTPRLSGDPCSIVYLNNSTVNDLSKKITETVDPALRKDLFQQLYDTLADDAGAIWLGQGVDTVALRDVVQGYQYYFSLGGNYVPLAQMSLTK
jgi:peptide/nickel transport system substrate-binding protein